MLRTLLIGEIKDRFDMTRRKRHSFTFLVSEMEPRQGGNGSYGSFRVLWSVFRYARPLLIERDDDGYRLSEYDRFDHIEQLSM